MPHTQANNVVGIFTAEAEAVRTRDELVRAGFRPEQIEMTLVRGRRPADVPATDLGTPRERSLGGALTFGIVGAIVCGLIGTAVATGWVRGIPALFDGGALAAVIGAAIGIVVGAVLGGLIGSAWFNTNTGFYAQELETGRFVLTVHADGRASEAATILRQNHAEVSP